NLLQCSVGSKPARLIEKNDATDRAANAFYLGHALFSIAMLVLAVFGNRPLDQRSQLDPATNTGVIAEVQLRNRTQFHCLAQLHTQEADRVIEYPQVVLDRILIIVLAHDSDEHLGKIGRASCRERVSISVE